MGSSSGGAPAPVSDPPKSRSRDEPIDHPSSRHGYDMSTAEQTFVIVGAGLAGAKAAEALREEGFDGRIILMGDETERPYDRPPLSKEYLQGKSEKEKIYVHPEGWYAGHDVDLRLNTRVTDIFLSTHEVTTESGDRV